IHARGEQIEFEWRTAPRGRPGVYRALGFWNHAKMGNYDQANAQARATGEVPRIVDTRAEGRTKLGFALNVEQQIVDGARRFARVGWNDGDNESFAYTEVDNTIAVGAELEMDRWSRPADQLGVALVSNGLSEGHREYLA